MNIAAYIKSLPRSSKKDDIPGTVEAHLEEPCPVCGKNMKLMKPCCGAPFGKKNCTCGYTVNLTG